MKTQINSALQRIPHTLGLLAIVFLFAACGGAAKEK